MPAGTGFSPKKPMKPAKQQFIPKASQLVPKAASIGHNSKLPGEAVIEFSVQPYTQKASDVIQSFPGDPLWQIQLKHDSRPLVTSRILASFGTYLTHLHATDPSMPDSLQSLRSQGIILVITAADDPESIGWVPWRIAFYSLGDVADLKNTLLLLDSYFSWRRDHPQEGDLPIPQPMKVDLCVPSSLRNQAWTGFENHVTLHSPARYDPFQAGPPAGKHVLQCSLEFHANGTSMNAVFFGQTYPFKDALEQANVYGARTAEDQGGQYVRVLQNVNIAEEAQRVFFLNNLLSEVFHGLVMLVRISTKPPESSLAEDFLGLLRDQPQIFVKP